MAARAGNKTTNAQRHRSSPPNVSFILRGKKNQKKKEEEEVRYLTGNLGRARRHLRPPGSHSKELAKTISLQSAAILIWQPDSITRRKNCFSRHQQSSGNYLNCVMIMPQSSGESFTFSPLHPPLTTTSFFFFSFFLFLLQHLRSVERGEINSSPPLVCLFRVFHKHMFDPEREQMLCEIPETEMPSVWHRRQNAPYRCLEFAFLHFEGDKAVATGSLLPPPEDGRITLFGPALIRLHL